MKWLLTVILIALTTVARSKTTGNNTAEDNSVVIVSSYNPDVKNTSVRDKK